VTKAWGRGAEDLRREVQAGGGGGDGAFLLTGGKDGLVALAVAGAVVAAHVMREGEVAVGVLIHDLIPLDEAIAIFGEDFDHAAGGGSDAALVADSELFPWADHALPAGGCEGFETQDFVAFVGEEAGGDDSGVVEDEEIAGEQELGDVAEGAMLDLTGGAVNDHHAGRGAVGERFAGDEFRRKMVVEVGGEHEAADLA
jgi:hypothetical protein